MQFPTREAEILRLPNDMAAGLAANAEIFPAPPYSPEDFRSALATHDSNREANIVAYANAARSTVAKGQSLATVEEMARSTARFAENVARGDDGKLQLIGRVYRRRIRPQDSGALFSAVIYLTQASTLLPCCRRPTPR